MSFKIVLFPLAIVLACCLQGLAGLALQRLPLANPIAITPAQLATITPNVRSEVLSLITGSMAETIAAPTFAQIVNSQPPLVAASPLNILPGTGYLTALSPLRSKIVEVRKPPLINPYPVAPFPYLTSADVAAAQATNPLMSIPQIQQAVLDTRKRKKTPAAAAPVQQPAAPVQPVQQNENSGQIYSIIQNALNMVQNNPDFMRSLLANTQPAYNVQQDINNQMANGLQISLFHGPESEYSPTSTSNHQTVFLQPQNDMYQQQDASGNHVLAHEHLNGLEDQMHTNMMSPSFQQLTSGY